MPPILANMAIGVTRSITRGYTKRTEEWERDLATMRMAANRQGDAIRHARKYIRLMRQQDHRSFIPDLRQTPWQIVETDEAPACRNRPLISEPNEPKRPAAL